MRYTTLDTVAIILLAAVAGIQFLRARANVARVFYETASLVGAAYGANRLYGKISDLTGWSIAVSFLVCFLVLAVAGLVLAALLAARLYFELGMFSYLIGLALAFVSAYSFGHAAMRVFEFGYVRGNPVMVEAMMRSWVARELLHFRTAVEVRAILRFARWRNL